MNSKLIVEVDTELEIDVKNEYKYNIKLVKEWGIVGLGNHEIQSHQNNDISCLKFQQGIKRKPTGWLNLE